VLSQAKQKTLLILPGFGAIDAPDDCSGQYTVRIVLLTIMQILKNAELFTLNMSSLLVFFFLFLKAY